MTPGAQSQPGNSGKLLDQMRDLMRVRRYALRTERSYCDWVRRYVKFHGMKCREDLNEGALWFGICWFEGMGRSGEFFCVLASLFGPLLRGPGRRGAASLPLRWE